MNRQEIIDQLKTLDAQIDLLHSKESLIEQKHDDLMKNFWFPHLCDYRVIEKGFFLDCSRNYFTIKRFRDGRAFSDTMITISITESYLRTTDEEIVRGIETSFYTTSESSDFELERMVVIGKVGQLILDKQDELIPKLDELLRARQAELRETYSLRWELERQRKELTIVSNSMRESEILEMLKEGVTFEAGDNALPRLPLRYNTDVPVEALKVLSVKSKTVNIEYKSRYSSRIVQDLIRLSNLETFISYYRDRFPELVS